MTKLREEKGALKDQVCIEKTRFATLGFAVVELGFVVLSPRTSPSHCGGSSSALIHIAQTVAHPRS